MVPNRHAFPLFQQQPPQDRILGIEGYFGFLECLENFAKFNRS